MQKLQTRTMVVVDYYELIELMAKKNPEAHILGFSDSIGNFRHRITLSLNELLEATKSNITQEELFDSIKSTSLKEEIKNINQKAGRPIKIFVIKRKFLHFEE
jgi:hypothetical protein